MILKVRRFDPSTQRSRYDRFEVRPKPGMTLLGALLYVQDRIDDTLSFRHSCRGAVCGACAVLVNKAPRLACRTQLRALFEGTDKIELKPYPAIAATEPWNPKDEVLVEPLPHLHAIKDLVVDQRRFFHLYRMVRPTFRPSSGLPERELRLAPAVVKELERYTNCILCAACHGACPVVGKNPDYLGPAALARLYRLGIDPRETDLDARLAPANGPNGWWACELVNNCTRVCPKGVAPSLAIGNSQRRLKESGSGSPEPKTRTGPETRNTESQSREDEPGKGDRSSDDAPRSEGADRETPTP
jgi:succinate dehydrogenase / fumarate reductase iron-sulfur subunit